MSESMVKPTGFFRGVSPAQTVISARSGGDPQRRSAQIVSTVGDRAIAQSDVISGQVPERMFRGAPKFWKITNRAQKGNVKVWQGAFDGYVFPEDSTDDKSTWLQPGASMLVPIEAGLHFCGNVFDPRAAEAEEIVERTGGMELETERSTTAKSAPVRIIGGPIGLPDFVIEPIDGRLRRVGEPIAMYDLYFAKVKRKIVRRKGVDPEVLAAEKELLDSRLAEYRDDSPAIYGPDGTALSSIADASDDDGLTEAPDMAEAPDDSEEAVSVGRGRRVRA